ncbi:MAG TPA: DUF1499 domain-containing protein [Methylothermaceae bacterium]|nr:DUF1499 domain-containing protein [Methylothermaceae bacterium]
MSGAYFKIALGAGIGILVLVSVVFWWLAQRSSTARPTLGLKYGWLLPCPDSPNCVSSHANPNDKTHYLPPIAFTDEPEKVWERLQKLLKSFPDATIVESKNNYLRAEFRSKLFGFVDDVEFLLDRDDKVIHFRSASRVGHSDLGANRKRIEMIRATLSQSDDF